MHCHSPLQSFDSVRGDLLLSAVFLFFVLFFESDSDSNQLVGFNSNYSEDVGDFFA